MKVRTLITAAALGLCSTAAVLADTDKMKGHEDPGGRKPSAGVGPSGGTGSNSMNQGAQIGAPGNIVTTVEGGSMTGHDKDANGLITKAEAAKNEDLSKQFAKLDVNGDAQLDAAEFAKFEMRESAVTGAAPAKPSEEMPAPK